MKEFDEKEIAMVLKCLRGGIQKCCDHIEEEEYISAAYTLGILYSCAESALEYFNLRDLTCEECHE
jgi:hypothetical protein